MQDVARALQYLHGRRPAVVHRDVKPPNFLVVRGLGLGLGLGALTLLPYPVPLLTLTLTLTRGACWCSKLLEVARAVWGIRVPCSGVCDPRLRRIRG
jgi:serine/threonine protein kinase